MEETMNDDGRANEVYRRLRYCVDLDFNWIKKIGANEYNEAAILRAIDSLTEYDLRDVIIFKSLLFALLGLDDSFHLAI